MSKLQCIEVGVRTSSRPIGIMLHGFGSCAENIAPLCNIFLDVVPYWLVLQAPVPMKTLFGYPDTPGYAWFSKQSNTLSNNSDIAWHNLEEYDTPDMVEAALLINKTLHAEHVFSSQVVLAGFSQGAMMATEVILQHTHAISEKSHTGDEENNNFAALLLFSSALLAKKRRTAILEKITTSQKTTLPSVMVSHGREDEILLYRQGKEMYEFWKDHAPYSDFCTFNGGHEIPNEVCEHSTIFLRKSLKTH